ncbi:response regulator [Sedimentitalea arenosa]|jgi:CheY-like chemotaxis protein|uniref:Response regulator n=1 Tax=Sedimentitalea arenosa TaxID=2798803 RepID=A0A8J7J0H7_9RHOB|nr:response regulator [Arenibacterium arenosum]MBJ6370915.1 response regulator [Arenibacterium arenosum]
MDDSDPFAAPTRIATANRPLLGLTILVVEDSRYACEAMRLLCLRSGARIRRADCLKSARRHLQVYRPSVVIADLGLPDGSGLDLIRELAEASPKVPVILGTSGDDTGEEAAIAAGADGFLPKPITSLALFQNAVLSRLPADQRPLGPRVVQDDSVCPDLMAYQDDMAHVADVLKDRAEEGKTLDYVAQFVGGVARSAQDTALEQAAASLAAARKSGAPVAGDTARIAGLVRERLEQKQAI